MTNFIRRLHRNLSILGLAAAVGIAALSGCAGPGEFFDLDALRGSGFDTPDAEFGSAYRHKDFSIDSYALTEKGRAIERSLGGR